MLGSVDAQHELEWRGRGAGLRSRLRDEPRHELSSYKSAAGGHGHFDEVSSGHVGAGDTLTSGAGWHFHAALPS